jgi:hypothetical protein
MRGVHLYPHPFNFDWVTTYKHARRMLEARREASRDLQWGCGTRITFHCVRRAGTFEVDVILVSQPANVEVAKRLWCERESIVADFVLASNGINIGWRRPSGSVAYFAKREHKRPPSSLTSIESARDLADIVESESSDRRAAEDSIASEMPYRFYTYSHPFDLDWVFPYEHAIRMLEECRERTEELQWSCGTRIRFTCLRRGDLLDVDVVVISPPPRPDFWSRQAVSAAYHRAERNGINTGVQRVSGEVEFFAASRCREIRSIKAAALSGRWHRAREIAAQWVDRSGRALPATYCQALLEWKLGATDSAYQMAGNALRCYPDSLHLRELRDRSRPTEPAVPEVSAEAMALREFWIGLCRLSVR